MTDTTDETPSITEVETHERGSDGQPLPVTETVEIHSQEYTVEIIPATTGQRNEWTQRLENEGEELSEEVTSDLLDEFTNHTPGDFGQESWSEVRPAVTDALSSAAMARLFDVEDTDEFSQALANAAAEAQGNQT